MVSADRGDYVESVAYDELLAQYQSLYDTAVAYMDMVDCGEMTVDQAKAALLAVRRLGGQ